MYLYGEKIPAFVYKKGKYTYVRDRRDNSLIAKSSKFNTQNIHAGMKISSTKKLIPRFYSSAYSEIRGDNVSIQKPLVNIGIIKTEKRGLGYKYTSYRKPPKSIIYAQMILNITFSGKMKQVKTVEAQSSMQDVHVLAMRKKMFDEAFKGCWSQINFSPDQILINWMHYEYYSKNIKSRRWKAV